MSNVMSNATENPSTPPEQVIWTDRVPRSARYDDPYYSLQDGLAETRHVFLKGNDLPGRFRNGFQVGELGFGTGLNALATLDAWREAGVEGRFKFTSFEAHPMPVDDMARALAAFPDLADDAATLCRHWADGARELCIGAMDLQVVIGAADAELPEWPGKADAWFLDGFAPARNPDMWSAELMQSVAERTRDGGSFATYTAARQVRDNLENAGFTVIRCDGFGRKRHMCRGVL